MVGVIQRRYVSCLNLHFDFHFEVLVRHLESDCLVKLRSSANHCRKSRSCSKSATHRGKCDKLRISHSNVEFWKFNKTHALIEKENEVRREACQPFQSVKRKRERLETLEADLVCKKACIDSEGKHGKKKSTVFCTLLKETQVRVFHDNLCKIVMLSCLKFLVSVPNVNMQAFGSDSELSYC